MEKARSNYLLTGFDEDHKGLTRDQKQTLEFLLFRVEFCIELWGAQGAGELHNDGNPRILQVRTVMI